MTQLQLFEGQMFESIGLHAALILNRLRVRAALTAPDEQAANQDGHEDGQEERRAEDREHCRGQAVDHALCKKTAL
jgi:hypothetical protein